MTERASREDSPSGLRAGLRAGLQAGLRAPLPTALIAPPFGPDFLAALEDLLARLGPAVSWLEFSRIPGREARRGPLGQVREVFRAESRFLSGGADQARRLDALATRSQASATAFRFLCLNTPTEEAVLTRLLGPGVVDRAVALGLMARFEGRIVLGVSLVPFGAGFYVSEARLVTENREACGTAPTGLAATSARSVAYLRRLLRDRPVPRMLEMGSGIGLVALELRDLAGSRDGAEYHQRNVDFANVNKAIHRDAAATFFRSNLFENVRGRFDFIFFNPWQPSERHLHTIEEFLERAPEFLEPHGQIVLLLASRWNTSGGDAVLERIAGVLGRRAMVAIRDLELSYRGEDGDGVVAQYYLRITAPGAEVRRGPVRIRTSIRGSLLPFQARKMAAQARTSLRRGRSG